VTTLGDPLEAARALRGTIREARKETPASKVQVGPRAELRDRPDVQATVAASEAELEAARLLLRDALAEVWAACCNGMPASLRQRARMWVARSMPQGQPRLL